MYLAGLHVYCNYNKLYSHNHAAMKYVQTKGE